MPFLFLHKLWISAHLCSRQPGSNHPSLPQLMKPLYIQRITCICKEEKKSRKLCNRITEAYSRHYFITNGSHSSHFTHLQSEQVQQKLKLCEGLIVLLSKETREDWNSPSRVSGVKERRQESKFTGCGGDRGKDGEMNWSEASLSRGKYGCSKAKSLLTRSNKTLASTSRRVQ